MKGRSACNATSRVAVGRESLGSSNNNSITSLAAAAALVRRSNRNGNQLSIIIYLV